MNYLIVIIKSTNWKFVQLIQLKIKYLFRLYNLHQKIGKCQGRLSGVPRRLKPPLPEIRKLRKKKRLQCTILRGLLKWKKCKINFWKESCVFMIFLLMAIGELFSKKAIQFCLQLFFFCLFCLGDERELNIIINSLYKLNIRKKKRLQCTILRELLKWKKCKINFWKESCVFMIFLLMAIGELFFH